MNLNNKIKVSVLRTVLSKKLIKDEEMINSRLIKVEYIDGIYHIRSNFELYQNLINNKQKLIPVEIEGDVSKVLSHLVYRVKREKINPIEIAFLFEEIKQITRCNQKQLSNLVEKTQGNISNKRRLLKLPLVIQMHIINDELTERHGRAMLQLIGKENSDHLIQQLYKEIFQKKLNVDETENVIRKLLGKAEKPKEDKFRKIESKRDKIARNILPLINQIEGDMKTTLELISKYNPEIQINVKEGLLGKDYMFEIVIKNARK